VPSCDRQRRRSYRYAGTKIGLKERLLSLEGVPVGHRARKIDRGHMYILAEGEVEYCVPGCGDISRKPLAEVMLFGRQHAEAVGLSPCSSCRPDLHPLSA
jgi:hypothetical protein